MPAPDDGGVAEGTYLENVYTLKGNRCPIPFNKT
jgi:hypothetical protein